MCEASPPLTGEKARQAEGTRVSSNTPAWWGGELPTRFVLPQLSRIGAGLCFWLTWGPPTWGRGPAFAPLPSLLYLWWAKKAGPVLQLPRPPHKGFIRPWPSPQRVEGEMGAQAAPLQLAGWTYSLPPGPLPAVPTTTVG